jgi:hypothetical protein
MSEEHKISLETFVKRRIKAEDYFNIVYQLIRTMQSVQREGRQVVLDMSCLGMSGDRLRYSIAMEDGIYEIPAIREFIKQLAFQCIFEEGQQLVPVTQFLQTIDRVAEINFYPIVLQYCENQLHIPAGGTNPADGETGVLEEGFWENLESKYKKDTTLIQENQTSGETEVLDTAYWQQLSGASGQLRTAQARLVHSRTGKVTVVNKENFWIGKGEVDLKIDKDIVSRRHAQIIVRQNHYFISDNDSTNKTYVDSREIPAKASVEIFNGTHIKFANEEYIFQI